MLQTLGALSLLLPFLAGGVLALRSLQKQDERRSLLPPLLVLFGSGVGIVGSILGAVSMAPMAWVWTSIGVLCYVIAGSPTHPRAAPALQVLVQPFDRSLLEDIDALEAAVEASEQDRILAMARLAQAELEARCSPPLGENEDCLYAESCDGQTVCSRRLRGARTNV